MIETKDPMGNRSVTEYDAKGNVVRTAVYGEMTDSTDAEGETLLSETVTEYDSLDRATRTVVSHFDPATGDPIGDGESETTTEYAPDGRALSTTDDNGNESGWTVLDTMNRVIASVDARGNARRMEYDDHSHVIAVESVEASDVPGAPERVTRTTMGHDALGRMVWRTDARGSTTAFEYDSRGNAVRVVDPLGNVVENDHDAMGRLVATRRILTDDGTGEGEVVGEIETLQEWDESSRLVAQIDDAGNATRYEYDAQNRRVAEVAGDGTEKRTTYNVFGDAVRTLDANGTRVDSTFDKLGRALTRTIVPASGVIGTTWENWTWDGLSRPRRAHDAPGLARSLNHLERFRTFGRGRGSFPLPTGRAPSGLPARSGRRGPGLASDPPVRPGAAHIVQESPS